MRKTCDLYKNSGYDVSEPQKAEQEQLHLSCEGDDACA
jgi:hypothetical protein